MMVAKETKKEIRQHLDQLKGSLNVDIIFAVEMGSRAWGFHSDNSDYDIRFIYRQPMSHYLTYNVETKKDIIELQSTDKDWDTVGWDIRKVCKLFEKSNGNLIEWLRSPISYVEASPEINNLKELAETSFNPIALCHHYYAIAKNHKRIYLDRESVGHKKYLYAVRSLICAEYIVKTGKLPAVNFLELLEDTRKLSKKVDIIYPDIMALVQKKQKGHELGVGLPIEPLDDFIKSMLQNYEKGFENYFPHQTIHDKQQRVEALEKIFRDVILSTL